MTFPTACCFILSSLFTSPVPTLQIHLITGVHARDDTTHRVWHCPQFQAPAGGLETCAWGTRGDHGSGFSMLGHSPTSAHRVTLW